MTRPCYFNLNIIWYLLVLKCTILVTPLYVLRILRRFTLDLRSGREVHYRDQRRPRPRPRRRLSSLPAVLSEPDPMPNMQHSPGLGQADPQPEAQGGATNRTTGTGPAATGATGGAAGGATGGAAPGGSLLRHNIINVRPRLPGHVAALTNLHHL